MTYSTPGHRGGGWERLGGVGAPMATVARIIRRHDGSLRAQGQTGMGATFYFAF